jgi:hypothetical protein
LVQYFYLVSLTLKLIADNLRNRSGIEDKASRFTVECRRIYNEHSQLSFRGIRIVSLGPFGPEQVIFTLNQNLGRLTG